MSTPNGSLSPEGRRRNCLPLSQGGERNEYAERFPLPGGEREKLPAPSQGESEMSTPNGSLSPPGRGLG